MSEYLNALSAYFARIEAEEKASKGFGEEADIVEQ